MVKPNKEKIRKALEHDMKAVRKKAGDLLKKEEFLKYREHAEQGQKQLLEAILIYDAPTAEQYAFGMKSMIIGYKSSVDLLEDIKYDAK